MLPLYFTFISSIQCFETAFRKPQSIDTFSGCMTCDVLIWVSIAKNSNKRTDKIYY